MRSQNLVTLQTNEKTFVKLLKGGILIRDKVKLEVKIFNFSKSFDYSLKICLGN